MVRKPATRIHHGDGTAIQIIWLWVAGVVAMIYGRNMAEHHNRA